MNRPTTDLVKLVCVWAILVILHFVTRTASLLSDPPSGDLYAYSWPFQALTFLVWPFPAWIGILCALLSLVYVAHAIKVDR